MPSVSEGSYSLGGVGWRSRHDRSRLQLCAWISSGGRISLQVAWNYNHHGSSLHIPHDLGVPQWGIIPLLCRLKAEKEWEKAAESLGELSQVPHKDKRKLWIISSSLWGVIGIFEIITKSLSSVWRVCLCSLWDETFGISIISGQYGQPGPWIV